MRALSSIGLRAIDGTVWLTQLEIAQLFDTSKQNVSLHLNNVLTEGELVEVVKESLTTAADGKSYRTKVYNLDAILAIGYRVRSPRGAVFEYIEVWYNRQRRHSALGKECTEQTYARKV